MSTKFFKKHKSSRKVLKMLKARVPKEVRDAKMIGFLPTPSLRAELERLAVYEERSLSTLCFLLVQKGLDAYHKDHDLRSPRNLPIRKGKNEP